MQDNENFSHRMKNFVKVILTICLFSALICDARLKYQDIPSVKYKDLHKNDTILVNGRIYVAQDVIIGVTDLPLCYPRINESDVKSELEKCLIRGYIYPEQGPDHLDRPALPLPKDLTALPYFIDMYSSPELIPKFCYSLGNFDYLYLLCTEFIEDERLFNLGYKIALNSHGKIGYSFDRGSVDKNYKQEKALIDGHTYGVDSLRVRVVAYNDRDALEKLEKYYRNKGDAKGIAIYYKVMLGYKGNGDLAERFCHVLEPYFEKTPEMRSVVRKVLLRAAVCDRNERAVELCDSLGFSICDYRLPVPDGTY